MSSPTSPAEKNYSRPIKLLSKKKLTEAWLNSRDASANPGARGIDGITAASFAAKFDERCDDIIRKVKTGSYRFSKLKGFSVPKDDGQKERLICIPTVQDRLVQRAMLIQLEEKIPQFEISKFDSKGSGGTAGALLRCMRLRDKYQWAAKTDIIQFFDKIPRNELKNTCRKTLKNSSLIPYLDQIVDLEIKHHNANLTKRHGVRKGIGLRQGMPLSPILSNLTLLNFDKEIQRLGIPALRYVDDIVVFGHTRTEVERHLKTVRHLLTKVELRIPNIGESSKTAIFGRTQPLPFLGLEVVYSNVRGAWIQRVSKKQIEKISQRVVDLGDFEKLSKAKLNFFDFASKVAGIENGYKSAYSKADNLNILLKEIQKAKQESTKAVLTHLFGPDAINSLDKTSLAFLSLDLKTSEASF